MPSATYDLFAEAIRRKQQIVCRYNGYERVLCPFVLGHNNGVEKALTFQFAGGSSGRLPPGGEWRCLFLDRVENAELRDGPWHGGASHTQPQGCVEDVDMDVNPDSPYHPKRPIGR